MEIKLSGVLFSSWKRILMMIMRPFMLLFCTTVFSFTTNNGLAQNTVTIEKDTIVSVDEVFKMIMDQTDYLFMYRVGLFENAPKVQLKKGTIKVDKLLSQSLDTKDFNVVLSKDNTIIIRKKKQNQQRQVSGKVTDASGTPLPGVAVVVKGTKNGVATDFDGNYKITVPGPESVLVFTSMGFDDKEIPVGNQQVINVTLQEAVSQLDEVVVSTGYWKEKRKLSTGNIGKIDSKVIERQPVVNPLEALQGQVAGVFIQQTSGIPGGEINIRIRGRNSLNDGRFISDANGNSIRLPNANQPFFVVDGVPFPSNSLNASELNLPNGSPLATLRPQDIESIEVLKDADATAIYGSRGANGVVLITTKKGKLGKLSFDLDYSYGLGEISNRVNVLNTEQFLAMRREAINSDNVPLTANDSIRLSDVFLWDPNRNIDWQEELLGGTAEQTNVSFTLSGGSEQTRFLFRGSFLNQTNVIHFDDSRYKQIASLLNVNHTSKNNKFQVDFTNTYTVNDNRQNGSPFFSLFPFQLAPNAPELFDEQGNINWENNFENPLRFLEQEYNNVSQNLVNNAVISYELWKGLILKTTLGYNILRGEETRITPLSSINPRDRTPLDALNLNSRTSQESWIVEPQLSYTTQLWQGKLNFLLGATFQSTENESLFLEAQGYETDLFIRDISAASQIFTTNSFNENRYNAVFARLNYNWKDKYILNLTGRRDGSSRFGPNRQFGNFGAVGVAWIFSNEKFLKDNSFLSFGKLRGSYGITGNDQIGDYQFLQTFGLFPSLGSYNEDLSLFPVRAANPDFGWEENKKLEFGLELGLFNNRIRLNTSWFRNRTDNQLIGRPLSAISGFSSVQFNLPALVENRGIELELNTVNISANDFTWTSAFNLTRVRNELLEFPNIKAFAAFDSSFEVGRSLFGSKQYRSLGVNPETGEYTMFDANGDGRISALDRQTFVEVFQDFYGGLNNSFSWKGLQLDIFFRFVKQNGRDFRQAFSGVPGDELPEGGGINMPLTVLDRWRDIGDVSDVQRFSRVPAGSTLGINHNRHYNSQAGLVDTSFIRLQNVSLSWNLPDIFVSNIGLENVRISVRGQNLLTITPFDGLDPETNGLLLPPLRIITTSVQLSF